MGSTHVADPAKAPIRILLATDSAKAAQVDIDKWVRGFGLPSDAPIPEWSNPTHGGSTPRALRSRSAATRRCA